jgi:hypothetical protein
MSLEARYDLFGDPSASLVTEAVWAFRQENEDWPLWEEAVARIAQLARVDEDEAERRLLGAVAEGEVGVRLRGQSRPHWGVYLDDATADVIARRYMDLTMPRRNREETW